MEGGRGWSYWLVKLYLLLFFPDRIFYLPGEGPYIRCYNYHTTTLLARHKILKAENVHRIIIGKILMFWCWQILSSRFDMSMQLHNTFFEYEYSHFEYDVIVFPGPPSGTNQRLLVVNGGKTAVVARIPTDSVRW